MTLHVASAYNSVDQSIVGNPLYDSVEHIDQLPVLYVPLSKLKPGFLVRETGTDPAHIQMLAEVANSSSLPPILVQESNSRIVDGMHRFEAAKLRGEQNIRARLVSCTDEEAFILAVKANTWHGLPLTRADRMSGARQIVSWHPDWSDRAIGVATGLSAKTISVIRRESADGDQQLGKRLGRDGKRRPVTASEGRRRAADYILARPDASLREIAREADVAPATAQDVRARLRRGADPVATKRDAPSPPPAPDSRTRSAEPRTWASPSASITRLRVGAVSETPTWPTISSKLANDPSLKYTDGGRALMGWMVMHVVNSGEWEKFLDAVPAHWLGDLSVIADQVGQEWICFAEHLRKRQDAADCP